MGTRNHAEGVLLASPTPTASEPEGTTEQRRPRLRRPGHRSGEQPAPPEPRQAAGRGPGPHDAGPRSRPHPRSAPARLQPPPSRALHLPPGPRPPRLPGPREEDTRRGGPPRRGLGGYSTLHFAEGADAQRVAQHVVADFHPPVVLLLLSHLRRAQPRSAAAAATAGSPSCAAYPQCSGRGWRGGGGGRQGSRSREGGRRPEGRGGVRWAAEPGAPGWAGRGGARWQRPPVAGGGGRGARSPGGRGGGGGAPSEGRGGAAADRCAGHGDPFPGEGARGPGRAAGTCFAKPRRDGKCEGEVWAESQGMESRGSRTGRGETGPQAGRAG